MNKCCECKWADNSIYPGLCKKLPVVLWVNDQVKDCPCWETKDGNADE